VDGAFVAAAIDELNSNRLRAVDGVIDPNTIPSVKDGTLKYEQIFIKAR
jgi:hypothetical protein